VALPVAGGARVDAGVGGPAHGVDRQTSLMIHRVPVAAFKHLIAFYMQIYINRETFPIRMNEIDTTAASSNSKLIQPSLFLVPSGGFVTSGYLTGSWR